jgi:hypothetical protein
MEVRSQIRVAAVDVKVLSARSVSEVHGVALSPEAIEHNVPRWLWEAYGIGTQKVIF